MTRNLTPLEVESDSDDEDMTSSNNPNIFFTTVSNIVIAILGINIFIAPWGYAKSGVLGGSLITILVAFASYSTTVCVLQLQQHYYNKTGEVPDYAIVVGSLIGTLGSNIVTWCTIVSCLGACVSYTIFLGRVFSHLLGISVSVVLCLVTPILLILSCIKSYSHLLRFSSAGIVFVFIALVLILLDNNSSTSVAQLVIHAPFFTSLSSSLEFAGPATFLFTVHYCISAMFSEILRSTRDLSSRHRSVQHLESSFDSAVSRSTPKSNAVDNIDHEPVDILQDVLYPLRIAFAVSTALVILHGCTAMAIYGDAANQAGRLSVKESCNEAVCQIVVLNLSPGYLKKSIEFLLGVSTFAAFPVMMTPAREQIEAMRLNGISKCLRMVCSRICGSFDFVPRSNASGLFSYFNILVRSSLVLLIVSFAVILPEFEDTLSIVGGITDATLAFIIPVLVVIFDVYGHYKYLSPTSLLLQDSTQQTLYSRLIAISKLVWFVLIGLWGLYLAGYTVWRVLYFVYGDVEIRKSEGLQTVVQYSA